MSYVLPVHLYTGTIPTYLYLYIKIHVTWRGLEDIYYFKVGPPLSLSTSKPKKQDTLTEYVKDEVYMQCDEVQDTKSAPKKMFYYNLFTIDKLKDKKNVSLDGGITEIVIYIIILLIICYGLYKGTSRVTE